MVEFCCRDPFEEGQGLDHELIDSYGQDALELEAGESPECWNDMALRNLAESKERIRGVRRLSVVKA